MKTEKLIEIARQCGGRYAYTNWGYHPFTLTELQQLAQRIEQPHIDTFEQLHDQLYKQSIAFALLKEENEKLQQRIAELEKTLQLSKSDTDTACDNNPYDNSSFWSNW